MAFILYQLIQDKHGVGLKSGKTEHGGWAAGEIGIRGWGRSGGVAEGGAVKVIGRAGRDGRAWGTGRGGNPGLGAGGGGDRKGGDDQGSDKKR